MVANRSYVISNDVSNYLLDTPSFMKTTKTIIVRFLGRRQILTLGKRQIEKRFCLTVFWILFPDKLSRGCIFQIFYLVFHFATQRVFSVENVGNKFMVWKPSKHQSICFIFWKIQTRKKNRVNTPPRFWTYLRTDVFLSAVILFFRVVTSI